MRNFLDCVWRMIVDDRSETVQLNPAVLDVPADEYQNRVLHRTLTEEKTIEIPVQVLGKVRARVRVAAEANEAEIETAARADEKVQQWIGGKQIVKVILVPGRLINFVVK